MHLHTIQPRTLTRRLFRDEDGGELMEYALIAGLVVVAAIGALKLFHAALDTGFREMSTIAEEPLDTGE